MPLGEPGRLEEMMILEPEDLPGIITVNSTRDGGVNRCWT